MSKKTEKYLSWLVMGIFWLSEYMGVQVAIFTPDLSIPFFLYVLWILVQAVFSVGLAWQIVLSVRMHEKKTLRLANLIILCIIMQIIGVLHSRQLFAGAAAIGDGFLLYFIDHWD
jgi:hypothetical protein